MDHSLAPADHTTQAVKAMNKLSIIQAFSGFGLLCDESLLCCPM